MSVKTLYRWVEDQIADFGDTGVAWDTLVSFGWNQVRIDKSRLDCCIADLLNARRVLRTREGRLIVR